MKNAFMIVCLLTAWSAQVQCMEQSVPPPYAPSAPLGGADMLLLDASELSRDVNHAIRIPQGNDTYMNYQQWWDKNKVPENIRKKSVREQEEWRTQRATQRAIAYRDQQDTQLQKIKDDAECSGIYQGACIASVMCLCMRGIIG